jgi:DNA (cytosine-5)-methyltransferase 1
MADKQEVDGQLRELALFAGAGGGILGGKLLGWKTVCAVETDPYCASVLVARQNDGFLPAFPIWDDVRTFDGKPWRGIVDVVSGGFPCQDISIAGNGAGLAGEKSRLWFEFQRIIGEVRPVYVFVENSPMLTLRGLDRVLGGLASLGYNAEWGTLGACDVGAPHIRKRIWLLCWDANSIDVVQVGEVCRGENTAACGVCADVADTDCQRFKKQRGAVASETQNAEFEQCGFWES